MMKSYRALLLVGVVLAFGSGVYAATIQQMNQMPLSFTKNMGQWDDRVLFRANAGGATMWFTKEGVTYQFTRTVGGHSREGGKPGSIGAAGLDSRLRGNDMVNGRDMERDSVEQLVLTAKFVGANPNPVVVGEREMEYKCNYFLGNDPTKWRTDVPNYEAITLKNIYPGVDLKYSGDGQPQAGQTAYEFIAAPGADIAQIKVAYEGAEATSLDSDGKLILRTKWGDMTAAIKSPTNGVLSGAGSFSQLSEKTIGFEANGSGRQALGTLGVTLSYSTYLGGGSSDYGEAIAVDGSGYAYVTGSAGSGFPTLNPYQTYQGGGYTDVFVTKLSNSGSLIYSTYLGGGSYEGGGGIAVDGSGNAYVTGYTHSSNFPTLNPYQATHQGGYQDAFVTKLSSSGSSLIYSTYLGGGDDDEGYGIAVDGSGNAHVTGGTGSSDFPTLNPYQTDQGSWDAFVTKLSSTGNGLIYSTYLGGAGSDEGWDITVDGSGYAYVTGRTGSSNFPTLSPYQTNQGGAGYYDAFVTKLSNSGSSLIYSTYLGGGNQDYGMGVAVDGSGSAYITGLTLSFNFPTQSPFQSSYQGNSYPDAFVTKLGSSGASLIYSTYLGGGDQDYGIGVAVDGSGNAHVTGVTWSGNFPTQNPFQPTYQGGNADAFVTKLSNSGNSLIYSTYLGGGGQDVGRSIAIDGSGNAYVVGQTASTNFPTLNPYQTHQGGYDAFVTKLRDGAAPPPVVFTDDFSVSSKPDWLNTQGSCSWNVTAGSWQTSATGQQVYCTKSVGDSTWRNYDYQVDIKGNSGVDKVANFRLQDASHWYGINLRSASGPGGAGEILLTKRSDSGMPALLTSAPFANTTGIWYTVKVSCVDELLKVYVNNNPALTYTDSADVYYSGGIGLTCYTGAYGSCDIAFDNVLVTDPYPHIVFTGTQGTNVGDHLSIEGRLQFRDGSAYPVGLSGFGVEDPVTQFTSLISVASDGSFTYTTPSSSQWASSYMFVFMTSTTNGVIRTPFAFPVAATVQSNVICSPHHVPVDVGPLTSHISPATDAWTVRSAVSGFRAGIGNVTQKAKGLWQDMKATLATSWRRTTSGGVKGQMLANAQPSVQLCAQSPLYLGNCAVMGATYGYLGLQTVKDQVKQVFLESGGLAYDAHVFSSCDLAQWNAKVEGADFALSFASADLDAPVAVVEAVAEVAESGEVLDVFSNAWNACTPAERLESAALLMQFPLTGGVNPAKIVIGISKLYDKAMVIRGLSPIQIVVTDSLGRMTTLDSLGIPFSSYERIDMDFDGVYEDIVIVPVDSALSYSITILTDSSATPSDSFSVIVDYTYYQNPLVLYANAPISEVPADPVSVELFENLTPGAIALITPGDTFFGNFPCVLRWRHGVDPNAGHLVSYRVVVARQSNFADSVAVEVGTDTTYSFDGRLWQNKAMSDTARYYWKVYAHDDWNASTASVDSRSFRVLYQCGDASGDATVDISDAVSLIAYIFSGGPAPLPLAAGDANCDGMVDISDAVYLIAYIFSGGPVPCAGC